MGDVLLDIRFACRSLFRSPLLVALAVVTLALGIGVATALFSLVDAVLLRSLPFKDPDRLVEIWGEDANRSGMRVPGSILDDLRDRSTTLEAIAIHSPVGGVLRTSEGAVDLRGDRVSANFVDVMGVPPLMGRGFLPEDERPGAPAVMLVTFNFWQKRLGGDTESVGRTVYLDTVPFTLIGIMPPEFRTSFRGITKEYWTPYVGDSTRALERDAGYELVARLIPGVTVDQSRREVQSIASSVAVPGWGHGARRLGMVRLKDEIVRDSAYALQLLLAAVVVVLAIACANLAQLMLARSDRRASEFATRQAIGATSARLFRLVLVESLMLSATGGVCGVGLAYWLVPALIALAPSEIPRLAESAIDGRVLAMSVGVTLLTGCAFGVAPALRLSRFSMLHSLTHTSRSGGRERTRFRSALVVVQVAASVTFCALAGLVGQTFLTLLPSNPGFEAGSRTVFPLSLQSARVQNPQDRLHLLQDLMRRLAGLPGVTEVGVASNIPFSGDVFERPVQTVDGIPLHETPAPRSDVRAVSSNVFQLLQMPLLSGRTFTSGDNAESPRVAIVNQTLARRLAPTGDVLGRTVRLGMSDLSPAYEIVGLVSDARSTGTSVDVVNEIYIPYAQNSTSLVYLILRSPLDSRTLTPAIRREIQAAAPDLPLRADQSATSMEDLIRQSLAGPRFSATLISAFSAASQLLAIIGLFGLVTYSVSQRRQELGIRAALGAGPGKLLVTTMRSAIVLTAVGIASGWLAAAYATRYVESQLYAIDPLDFRTFAAAGTVMLALAGLAAYVPARRAVHADSITVLRHI